MRPYISVGRAQEQHQQYLQNHREYFANIIENMNEKEHHIYLQNLRDSFRNRININLFLA